MDDTGSLTVQLTWHSPLDRIMGEASEETVAGETTVESFLVTLREREPRLQPYAKWEPGDSKAWGLLVLRGSDMLRLADAIRPGDRLDMLAMLEGG
jgi:hypothetical protein